MTSRADAPAERILRLAAYASEKARHHATITLTDIVDDVPGYESSAPRDEHGSLISEGPEWETVRKRLTRDISDLHEHWSIRLEYDDGEHYYRLAAPFLTVAERRALVAAAATVSIEGSPGAHPGDVGAAVDDSTALVVVRLHELVAELRDAIRARVAVSFRYEGRLRHVEPYALGMWRNRWYLAGRDQDADGLRRFRLDRIDADGSTAITRSTETYAIDPGFEHERAFDLDPNVWGPDPCVRARVRVGRDHVDAFLAELGGAVVETDTEHAFVELDVREYRSFRTRLLAFRGAAVVLEPPELVAVVRDHLAQLARTR